MRICKPIRRLRKTIRLFDSKRKKLLMEWILKWCNYLSLELSNKTNTVRCERGSVILADFGFNIGYELGGRHYAVVIENLDKASSGTIVVAPIYSMKGRQPSDLQDYQVYTGILTPNATDSSYCNILQIRTISKMRIIKNNHVKKLSTSILNKIDTAIKKYFTYMKKR